MPQKQITRADVMPLADYEAIRKPKRKEMAALKKTRRMEVGPFCTFYFESFATMWHQIHEMLAIEKGGEAQIADELDAYNPLIPQGSELVATVMFEIDDEVRRKNVLNRLGGVEDTMFIELGGERVMSRAEVDADRTTAEGKASSVQFVHFDFSPAQIAAFKTAGTQVLVGVAHENYGHIAVMPEATRAALATDFD
ncbi:MAG: DUF3501 family protein [Alphaproteobacteria bacterium]|nr:DUF3501 family protein [Alphaproteobacteria bacterium]MCB9928902.1 DUF3501 family protein [Alphaproteobacteria bacterium]